MAASPVETGGSSRGRRLFVGESAAVGLNSFNAVRRPLFRAEHDEPDQHFHNRECLKWERKKDGLWTGTISRRSDTAANGLFGFP